MKRARLTADPGHCDEAFLPYRHLALRVLARAFQDMSDPAGALAHRESARDFFASSDMLLHWCRVASLDPQWIAERAERLSGSGLKLDCGLA